MPRYMVKAGSKFHLFSTVVMDAITEDLDAREMGEFLEVEYDFDDDQTAAMLKSALQIGSTVWVNHTGGAYRPQAGVEPRVYEIRMPSVLVGREPADAATSQVVEPGEKVTNVSLARDLEAAATMIERMAARSPIVTKENGKTPAEMSKLLRCIAQLERDRR